jgi:HAD superfamily hydrolase (TIGR01459 family)
MNGAAPTMTAHFSALASHYDAVLCDVWGVVHNGVRATPAACDALLRFRDKGGHVVLITNAPRPNHTVRAQLDSLDVPDRAYDGIVSSGDVTRAVIQQRAGQALFHLGPARDKPIFAGLDLRFAPLESADYVVCSGLDDDETETPEDYRPRLEAMLKRRQFMVCANPDVVVERGSELVYCAGAIADLYREMGGEVLYAGKPYPPIYDLAFAQLPSATPPARVLAIGDSLRTDLTGANAMGLDFLFITGGIHAADFGAQADSQSALRNALAGAKPPVGMMWDLSW